MRRALLVSLALCLLGSLAPYARAQQTTTGTTQQATQPAAPQPVAPRPVAPQYPAMRLTGYTQVWLRQAQNNPGTQSPGGRPLSNSTDLSIRRMRLTYSGLVHPKWYALFKVGFNNLNPTNGQEPPIQWLEGYLEYRHSQALHVGAGKSGWNGISRYSAPAATTSLGTDISILPLGTVNITDRLIRNISIYAKGQIHQLDYRLVLFYPYAVPQNPTASQLQEGQARFTNLGRAQYWGAAGYFKWFLAQKESNTSAYHAGTYLNTKKVVNLGAGFSFQPNRTSSLQQGAITHHDLLHLGADFFVNLPLAKRQALTFYTSAFWYDYGPNYIRNIGVNNTATRLGPNATFNGPGVAYPLHGTGTSSLTQLGYYWPLGPKAGLMPYAYAQLSWFNALDQAVGTWYGGLCFYPGLKGVRLGVDYQSRPVFEQQANRLQATQRKGVWVFMAQLKF